MVAVYVESCGVQRQDTAAFVDVLQHFISKQCTWQCCKKAVSSKLQQAAWQTAQLSTAVSTAYQL